MAFTVEDGSGVKGATSYTTVAFFRAYFADRGIDVSSLTDDQVQAALVAATDYIDTRWGLRFLGRRRWYSLLSRVVFSLSDQPTDGETITIGGDVFTFRNDPTLDTEIEIGDTVLETIANIPGVVSNDYVSSFFLADPDVAALTIYISKDGIAVSTDAVNGAFDNATSTGYSSKQQPLEFPREYLRDRTGELVDSVPDRLKEATCEYAYRANSSSLAPDPTTDATGLQVTGTRKKVGPIETEIQYAEGAIVKITKPYPAADRLLQEYVTSGNQVIR